MLTVVSPREFLEVCRGSVTQHKLKTVRCDGPANVEDVITGVIAERIVEALKEKGLDAIRGKDNVPLGARFYPFPDLPVHTALIPRRVIKRLVKQLDDDDAMVKTVREWLTGGD